MGINRSRIKKFGAFWLDLHRNQQGIISILSVFAAMILTMLLGMVMNVGRQVDGKIRMQNAADAAAYSGAVVVTRGLNALSFTNHLLCEVFAVTAILREGRDRNAERYVPDILAAWGKEPPQFAMSGFPKFINLGTAIQQKIPWEQQLVTAYNQWISAVSAVQLPVLEEILARELIPDYQRAVLQAFPDIAQTATRETARKNGTPDYGRGTMYGALWRASGDLVGGDYEMLDPTLPVVDPVYGTMPDQSRFLEIAHHQRDDWAKQYLNEWNRMMIMFFDRYAKMGQFGALWRGFTCGQMQKLLEEISDSNLPMVIRDDMPQAADLHNNYTFLGVVYWRKLPELMPKVFSTPAENDAVAYAEAHVFVPRQRLVFWAYQYNTPDEMVIGGVPGDFPTLSLPDQPKPGQTIWKVARDPVPVDWSLFNQHWTCQLAPATEPGLSAILQTEPPQGESGGAGFRMPNLGGTSWEEIQKVSPH